MEASEYRFRLRSGTDPLLTIAILRQGPQDPQMRFEPRTVMRATRTEAGPASLHLVVSSGEVVARGWGPGAEQAIESVPGLIGELDDPTPFEPRHPVLIELARRLPGLRLARGGRVIEALVPSILAQKITGPEARRAHAALLNRYGEPAPGPLRLVLPPPPEKLARLPYWAFHPLGIERRRADTIRVAAAVAGRLEALATLPAGERAGRLMSLPGIGPWTTAETLRLALADPDAVSVGDFHLPRLVCLALAGERDGDDARMLELLEPYAGQRARATLLLEHSGMLPKRRSPRRPTRSIAAI